MRFSAMRSLQTVNRGAEMEVGDPQDLPQDAPESGIPTLASRGDTQQSSCFDVFFPATSYATCAHKVRSQRLGPQVCVGIPRVNSNHGTGCQQRQPKVQRHDM